MVVIAQLKEVLVAIALIIGISMAQWLLGAHGTPERQGALFPVVDPVRVYPIAVSSSSDYSAR